jgi:hypothetical protein
MRSFVLRFAAFALVLNPFALAAYSHAQPAVLSAGLSAQPGTFNSVAQQGYRDGMDAGMRDIRAGRRPNAGSHSRFRNPPVPSNARNDYRRGFQNGYSDAFRRGPR